MPELPEVETTLRGILPHIKHQTIKRVIVREHRLRWPISSNIETILSGKKIIDVERRAKYILIKVDVGTVLIHLGMSGCLRILDHFAPVKKHDHLDVVFQNKIILRFTDPRRFGAFLWIEGDPHLHPLLSHLAPEPLTHQFTGNALWRKAQNKKIPIKSLIMDNKIVTGVGNIYACESLFDAGIYPAAPAKSISLERCARLVKSIKKILRHAIRHGGTTLKDFLNSEGKPGYFRNELKVYNRDGQPCVRCQTKLKFMKIGQRSTVYCERCQKM